MSEGLFAYEPEVSRECAASDHSRCTQESCKCGCHRLPSRPYTQDGEKSAGWSGTDTSKAGEKARGKRQVQILSYLTLTGQRGATAKEVREALNLDHGKISGPLSVLHRKDGLLVLLKEKRDGFRVYCCPANLNGRDHD